MVVGVSFAGCEFFVQSVAPTPTLLTAGSNQQRPVVAVEFGILEEAIKVTGRVEAEERQDLFFRAPGRIKNVTVRQGELVEVGQVLAELETGGLESQVADAEKNFETAELRVFSAEAGLEQDHSSARTAVLVAENNVATKEQTRETGHTNAESAVLQTENSVATAELALENLLAGGTESQQASARASVASANSSYVSASATQARLEASSLESLAGVLADVATRQAAVTAAEQALAAVQAQGAPTSAEAQADALRRMEILEADVATAQSAFYQSEADLVDVLNKPTAAQRLDAENTFEKARLDHEAAVGGSGSDESKLKAEIIWQEAIRAYNDALMPATDAEIVAAQADVVSARSALLGAEQALDVAMGGGTRQAAIDRLAAEFQNEFGTSLASAEATLSSARANLAEAQYELAQVEAGRGTTDVQRARASTASASAGLVRAQTSLDALLNPTQSEIDSATRAVEMAESNRDIAVERLAEYESGQSSADLDLVILRRNLETSEETLARYDAGESSKDFDLVILRNSLEKSRISLQRLQDQTFENQVIAPFAGEVTFVRGRPGDQVAAYQEIIGLANPARLIIEAVVPEVDQPSLSVGQPVEITMDAFAGVVFTGRVTTLPRNIISTTGQTVKIPETVIDGDFDRAGMDIGMLARLKIVVQVKEDVLKVPLTAVRTVNNRDFVETIIDGQRRSLPVTVGIQSDTEIEILDGLEEGQQIFASP